MRSGPHASTATCPFGDLAFNAVGVQMLQDTLSSSHAPPRLEPGVGTVLVVDDTEAQRYAVARVLRAAGHLVIEAATGAEAIEAANVHRPEVVVLDVRLPDMDGMEVCRRLKTVAGSMLPVLHLSALATSVESRTLGLDAGADAYLTHPFDPGELRATVRALVRLKHQEALHVAEAASYTILHEALDALAEHIAMLDGDGTIVAVNRAWEQFGEANGAPQQRPIIGANYLRVCDAVRGEGEETARVVAAGLRGLLAGESEEFAVEYPCHSPTEERWFVLRARSVARGSAIAAVVTHENRTAERQAREAEHAARDEQARTQRDARLQQLLFRSLIARTGDLVAVVDEHGRFTYLSPSVERILGYSPSSLLGTYPDDLVHPDDRETMLRTFAGLAVGGHDANAEMTVRMRHVNGSWRWCEGGGQNLLHSPAVQGIMMNARDVTTRHETERAMAAALAAADLDRRRLAATLEAIPVGVWLADANACVTHVNPAVARIWRSPSEFNLERVDDFRGWRTDDGTLIPLDRRPLARAILSGETIHEEAVDIGRLDGTRGHILVSAAPIHDVEGNVTGGVAINVDVTELQASMLERERLVTSIATERERLAAVFEQAPAFVAILRGPNYVYERINPAYQELIGHRDVIGRPLAEAVPELATDTILHQLHGVRTTGHPFIGRRVPARVQRTPGIAPEHRYVDMVFQPLVEADGSSDGIIVLGVDVTPQVVTANELMQSEQRLRNQFAKLPVPTFLWEATVGGDFVLVDFNEAAEPILGEGARAAIGARGSEIFPAHLDIMADCSRCLREGVVIRRETRYDAGPRKGQRTFQLTIGPQPPDRVLLHAVDVTEREELELRLRQAQKMDAVGRLAGGVAHDFNNLLTVIGAHSSFLLDALDPLDARREDVEAIQGAATRAGGLTRQLLAFSRKQILRPAVLELNDTVRGVQKMLARLIGEHIRVETMLSHELGNVLADAGQLEQVLINLAVNARDAMPAGGTITMETGNVVVNGELDPARPMPAGEYVRLAVRDSGTGMDEATRGQLFEPFFTTKETGKGTGLGLATVYGIVKQSAGYIWVQTDLGKGTTFEMYFPRVQAEDAPTQLRVAEAAVARGKETVLIVEDEPAVRLIARRVLQRQGYNVLEARSGEEARSIALAYDAPIHLVLTDAVMPGIGGAEVVRQLREKRPGIRAIYMSGYTDDEVVRRGIVAADVPFLQKPFALDDLGRLVREVLDSEG